MGITRFEVALTVSNDFPHQIKPSAIEVGPVLNRSVIECLAFFVGVDT